MPGPTVDKKRDQKICDMYAKGDSVSHICGVFGFSRQRLDQILSRNGREFYKFFRDAEKISKNKEKREAIDNKFLISYGHTRKEMASFRDRLGEKPIKAYKQQRNNAKARKILWNFSFEEWWAIWESSGKWSKRGRKMGQYVMGRKDDKGPYSIDNVDIITCSANIADGYEYMKKGGCK